MLTTRRAALSDVPAILALVRRVVPLMQASGNFQWSADYPNEARSAMRWIRPRKKATKRATR